MRLSPSSRPQLIITMGDPSGIGPEVIMKSMANLSKERFAIFVVVGDSAVLERAARAYYGGPIAVKDVSASGTVELDENAVNILDPGPKLMVSELGKPTEEGARKALASIDAAVRMIKENNDGTRRAIVTAPVSKQMIASIHPGFIGHTEYLQEAFSSKTVSMVLAGKVFSVIPVTRHIPLKDVAGKLSQGLIFDTILQAARGRFLISGKKDAIIGVTALNPHGGEGGKMGREEIDIIKPAVDKAKLAYPNIEGPIPADVVFFKAFNKEIDIVVGMYHDQCLAPFKMVEFSTGVNMTLGLGCVRTSPDHGTAFDIAAGGIASPGSMIESLRLAARAVEGQ